MSDEYPGDEPGTATPAWAATPTMPWARVPMPRPGDTDPRGIPPVPPDGPPPPRGPARPTTYGGGTYQGGQPEGYSARPDHVPSQREPWQGQGQPSRRPYGPADRPQDPAYQDPAYQDHRGEPPHGYPSREPGRTYGGPVPADRRGPDDQGYHPPRRPGHGQPPDPRVPDQRHPDQRYPDQRRSDERHPDDQRNPDQRNPDQRNPDQRNPDQRRPDQRHPDQRHPDQGRSDQRHPDQRYSDQRYADSWSSDPRHGDPWQDDARAFEQGRRGERPSYPDGPGRQQPYGPRPAPNRYQALPSPQGPRPGQSPFADHGPRAPQRPGAVYGAQPSAEETRHIPRADAFTSGQVDTPPPVSPAVGGPFVAAPAQAFSGSTDPGYQDGFTRQTGPAQAPHHAAPHHAAPHRTASHQAASHHAAPHHAAPQTSDAMPSGSYPQVAPPAGHGDPAEPVSGGRYDHTGLHEPQTGHSGAFPQLTPPHRALDPIQPGSGGRRDTSARPTSGASAHSHAAGASSVDKWAEARERAADPLDPATPIELNDDLDLFASGVEPAGSRAPGSVVEPASAAGIYEPASPGRIYEPASPGGTTEPASPASIFEPASPAGSGEPQRSGSGSYPLVRESILDAGTFMGDPAPPVPVEAAAAHDGPQPIPPALTRAGVDGLQATGYLPIVRPGAAGFPPELAAIAPADVEPAPGPKDVKGPDPEQILAGYEWRFDPDTLREQIEGDEIDELQEIRDLLTTKLNNVEDNPSRARLLSLRAVVSRILRDLPKAFADGKLALAHAEATGELRRIAIAQARLAHVLQWREEFEEADRLFAQANSPELPDRLRATMHQHTGKCAYDQGRYMEACNHFELALDLRKEEDPELIAQTELALDAVFRRVAEKGWGPYPRSREEILQMRKPPPPAFDESSQRWGFITADGEFCIGPGYVDVQPFRDGVAWVQRDGSETWELIDDSGRSLIDPTAGYPGVSSFSDGLAWVSRDGTTRWIAIDKNNTVLISTGFDDVRPFRRGVAAVRRGGRWGAVDGVGRMVVPFQFDGFATALHDGRYIDGFNDEGLAVVSLSGRKGVVDRSGRVIVPPVHHILMVHPVAFLVADESQRWGALDRRGRPVIDLTFPSRMGVIDEIDRLLADTRPVM